MVSLEMTIILIIFVELSIAGFLPMSGSSSIVQSTYSYIIPSYITIRQNKVRFTIKMTKQVL